MDLFHDFIGPSLCCFNLAEEVSKLRCLNAFCSNCKLYLQFKNTFKALSSTLCHVCLHNFVQNFKLLNLAIRVKFQWNNKNQFYNMQQNINSQHHMNDIMRNVKKIHLSPILTSWSYTLTEYDAVDPIADESWRSFCLFLNKRKENLNVLKLCTLIM